MKQFLRPLVKVDNALSIVITIVLQSGKNAVWLKRVMVGDCDKTQILKALITCLIKAKDICFNSVEQTSLNLDKHFNIKISERSLTQLYDVENDAMATSKCSARVLSLFVILNLRMYV